MGLKNFTDFVSEIKESKKNEIKSKDSIIDGVDSPISNSLPKPRIISTKEKINNPVLELKTTISKTIPNLLEKITFRGKTAQFPSGYKPSEVYLLLEQQHISKEKLNYLISEQSDNSLLIVKYNEKIGPSLKEFVNSLLTIYRKNDELKPLVDQIKLEGTQTFVWLKNIPQNIIQEKKFIQIINRDLVGLLNGLK